MSYESPALHGTVIRESEFRAQNLNMRIRVFSEGKIRDAHLRGLQADYVKRIAHFTEFALTEIPRPGRSGSVSEGRKREAESTLSPAERRLWEKLRGAYKVFLDSRGRQWTSAEFAEWLGQQAVRGTRDLAFVVGGTEGFSHTFRREADLLLSLSTLTLTRDWARTLLLEQIYRAFTILRGYPYAR
jgi:23S rRNA (pseudouridine1915-N3)-methyltransferase